MTPFESFLNRMKASFGRIARATKFEMLIEDVQQEAWFISYEIEKKRGYPLDLESEEDQSLLLRWAWTQHVKRGDWKLRTAIRIDKEVDGEEGTRSLAETLPASTWSDPLVALLLKEASINSEKMLKKSYSQAAAYIKIFVHFKNERNDVCFHLAVSPGVLASRVKAAAETVRVQPSLFDGKEKISTKFMPLLSKYYPVRIKRPLDISSGNGILKT